MSNPIPLSPAVSIATRSRFRSPIGGLVSSPEALIRWKPSLTVDTHHGHANAWIYIYIYYVYEPLSCDELLRVLKDLFIPRPIHTMPSWACHVTKGGLGILGGLTGWTWYTAISISVSLPTLYVLPSYVPIYVHLQRWVILKNTQDSTQVIHIYTSTSLRHTVFIFLQIKKEGYSCTSTGLEVCFLGACVCLVRVELREAYESQYCSPSFESR